MPVYSYTDVSGQARSDLFGFRNKRKIFVATLGCLNGTYGGIQVNTSSPSALVAAHILYEETSQVSESLNMTRRDPSITIPQRAGPGATQWTTRAPMFALSAPDPALGLPAGTVLQPTILVHNAGGHPLSAEVTLNWSSESASGQVKLPSLTVAPFATQQLQIGPMQEQLGIPDDAHWAIIALSTAAPPDDLVAVASSRDATGRYHIDTNFSGTVTKHFAGGEWRADATHNQFIAVTNSGQKPADALLTLHYDNGQKSYEMRQTIKPAGQMLVSLAGLIRNRAPDRKGNLLPADLSSGTYDVRQLNSGPGALGVDALALDKTFGYHADQPSPDCCAYDNPNIDPDAINIDVDGFTTVGATAEDSCTANPESIFDEMTDWWSGNAGIARVSRGNSSATVTAVAPGSTTTYAEGYVAVCQGDILQWRQETLPAPTNVVYVPSGEITEFEGTTQITQGQFLMTLTPGTYSYDGNSVTESSPVSGTNACWWNGSGMEQYPIVQGSTWVVDTGDAGHDQYGLDTIGYAGGVINLIQTQGPAHDVEFPCAIDIYQSMNYEGIDLYVTNLLTQKVGTNSVTVCRAGTCSGTIPY